MILLIWIFCELLLVLLYFNSGLDREGLIYDLCITLSRSCNSHKFLFWCSWYIFSPMSVLIIFLYWLSRK